MLNVIYRIVLCWEIPWKVYTVKSTHKEYSSTPRTLFRYFSLLFSKKVFTSWCSYIHPRYTHTYPRAADNASFAKQMKTFFFLRYSEKVKQSHEKLQCYDSKPRRRKSSKKKSFPSANKICSERNFLSI